MPDRYIATMSKAARRGKIFIDYLRNGRGATSIAPYSTRSRLVGTGERADFVGRIDAQAPFGPVHRYESAHSPGEAKARSLDGLGKDPADDYQVDVQAS